MRAYAVPWGKVAQRADRGCCRHRLQCSVKIKHMAQRHETHDFCACFHRAPMLRTVTAPFVSLRLPPSPEGKAVGTPNRSFYLYSIIFDKRLSGAAGASL